MYFGSGGSLIQNDHPQTDALRGGPRNSSGGGGCSGPEFFKGGGRLGSRSAGIFKYSHLSLCPCAQPRCPSLVASQGLHRTSCSQPDLALLVERLSQLLLASFGNL